MTVLSMRWFLFAAVCLLPFAFGCDRGPKTYPVSGLVSFPDGTPLSSGFVELVPKAGGASGRGSIGKDGKFVIGTFESADGAMEGHYDVLVVQHISPATRRMARKLGDVHKDHDKTNRVVAKKYSSRSSSDLECTVKPIEENHFDFKVEPN